MRSSTKTSSTSLQPLLRPAETKENVPFVGHWDLLHLQEFREQRVLSPGISEGVFFPEKYNFLLSLTLLYD